MNLRGRVALMTRASSGIGRTTALCLAEAGAGLAIGDGLQEQAARGCRGYPPHGKKGDRRRG